MYDKNEILYMQINVFFTKGSINTKLKKKKEECSGSCFMAHT